MEQRQRKALSIALLPLVLACQGEKPGGGTTTSADCPQLNDEQMAEFVRLQQEGTKQYMGEKREGNKAIELFEQAMKLNPCDPSIHNDLGIAYHQAHEIKRAIEVLQKGIALDPLYPMTHLNLAIVYDDFANLAEAEKEYKAFIDLNPSMAEAHSRLGLVYLKMDRTDDAKAELEKASALAPDDWDLWHNLANIAFKEKDYAKAESLYSKTLTANPNFAEAHYKLGQTLQRLGRDDEAKPHFDEFKVLSAHQEKIDELSRMLKQNTDRADAVHMLLGMQYTAISRFPQAVEHFQKSIELNPSNPEAHLGLASALRQKGDFDGAAAAAWKAQELAPNLLQAYEALAGIYNEQGNRDKAIEIVRLTREKVPEYHDALLNLGILERERDRYPEAIAALQEYIGLEPTKPLPHEVLMAIYLQATDKKVISPKTALEHAKQAEKLGSRRFDLIAESYHMTGQLERATEWLDRAIAEASPEDLPSLKEHRAEIVREQSRK